MMKKIEMVFRTDKPKKSGEYLTVGFTTSGKRVCSMHNVFYNADTERWNDPFGDGEHAFDVEMWAEIPHEELKEIRKEK